jgi:hypothetical protein
MTVGVDKTHIVQSNAQLPIPFVIETRENAI